MTGWTKATAVMLAGMLVGWSGMGLAQSNTAQAPAEIHVLEGWRGLKFGMTEKDVMKVLGRDFKLQRDQIQTGDNRLEKTRFFATQLPDVIEGLGDAALLTVFGYKAKTMDRIELVWQTLYTETDKVIALQDAGGQLRNYFLRQGYDPTTIAVNRAVNDNTYVFFAGRDANGRQVSVSYIRAGIPLVEGENDAAAQANPDRATLRLTYAANPEKPDIFKIGDGEF